VSHPSLAIGFSRDPPNQRANPGDTELPTSNCPDCTAEARCGKYHVYVIQLKASVASIPRFKKVNPGMDPARPCFYVGSTKHKPQCRLNQHKRFFADHNSFDCPCGKGKKNRTRFFLNRGPRGRTRGNRFAGEFGLFLKSEIVADLNPLSSRAKAEGLEHQLAVELRELGHGVWQG
jgi:hypothetical protein